MSIDRVSPKIIAHHVGARGFGVSLNVPPAFQSDLIHVLYEADADAVSRMEGEGGSEQARLLTEKYVLPFCLGRKRGSGVLNITANSYASSLLAPNPDFARYYCEIAIDGVVYDVTYGDMLEVVKQVPLEIHSIDELFAEGKIPVPAPPDFLSLDTQGYELEILHGAQEALKSVVGIVCEVEMIPMYSNQPLLGDILNFATRNGFIFSGFTMLYEVSPFRARVGLRGKAIPGFGDALFLRDIAGLTERDYSADQLYVMLSKLAFIAMSFGYVEYALAARRKAKLFGDKVSPAVKHQLQLLNYSKFLDQLDDYTDDEGGRFPPVHAMADDARAPGDNRTSWYNKYHKAALQRFAASRTSRGAPLAVGNATVKLRILLIRSLRRLLRVLTSVPDSAASVVPAANEPYTAFESMLSKWGFGAALHSVQQRRMAAEPYLDSMDDEMRAAAGKAHLPL